MATWLHCLPALELEFRVLSLAFRVLSLEFIVELEMFSN